MPRTKSPAKKSKSKRGATPNPDCRPCADSTDDTLPTIPDPALLASSEASLPGLKSSPGTHQKRAVSGEKILAEDSPEEIPDVNPSDFVLKAAFYYTLAGPEFRSDNASSDSPVDAKSQPDSSVKTPGKHKQKKCPQATPKNTDEAIPEPSFIKLKDRALISSADRSLLITRETESDSSEDDEHPVVTPNLGALRDALGKTLPPERYKEILSYFTGDKSELDLFSYMWDLEEVKNHVVSHFIISEKSEKLSIELRGHANVHYRNKNYVKALELYNMAIIAAPHPPIPAALIPRYRMRLEALTKAMADLGKDIFTRSEDGSSGYTALAECYANRSALLFAEERYEKCIGDINFAIMYGMSEMMEESLEHRRQKCVEALSITKPRDLSPEPETKLTFKDLVEKFEEFKNTDEVRLVTDFLLSPCKRGNIRRLRNSPVSPTVPEIHSPSSALSNFSSAVSLAYHPDKGRYLIANRPIRVGEVLAIESSYVSNLFIGYLNSFCSTCFIRCYTILPCPNCTKVVFCSNTCWVKGLTGEHLKECNALGSLVALQRGLKDHLLPHLAYKMLINLGHVSLQENLPQLEKDATLPPEQRGFNQEGKYTGTEFRNVYHLQTNKEHFTSEELYSNCVTAFVLLKLLLGSEAYFVDWNGELLEPSRQELINTGATLLRLLLNLSSNAYEITMWQLRGTPLSIVSMPQGAGLFPTVSLVNHSCNPTARHYFTDRKMILRSITFIRVGEEVTIDYCGHYYEKPFKVRKVGLSNYFITCKCDACTGKWPIYKYLPAYMHIPCQNCREPVSLMSSTPCCWNCKIDYKKSNKEQSSWWRIVKHVKYAKERYDSVHEKVLRRHKLDQDDMAGVANYLEVLKKNAALPVQEYCFAQETLYKLFIFGF